MTMINITKKIVYLCSVYACINQVIGATNTTEQTEMLTVRPQQMVAAYVYAADEDVIQKFQRHQARLPLLNNIITGVPDFPPLAHSTRTFLISANSPQNRNLVRASQNFEIALTHSFTGISYDCESSTDESTLIHAMNTSISNILAHHPKVPVSVYINPAQYPGVNAHRHDVINEFTHTTDILRAHGGTVIIPAYTLVYEMHEGKRKEEGVNIEDAKNLARILAHKHINFRFAFGVWHVDAQGYPTSTSKQLVSELDLFKNTLNELSGERIYGTDLPVLFQYATSKAIAETGYIVNSAMLEAVGNYINGRHA